MALSALHALLGLSPDASAESIRHAFRQRALELHPDRNAGNALAKGRYEALMAAYSEWLSTQPPSSMHGFPPGLDPATIEALFKGFFAATEATLPVQNVGDKGRDVTGKLRITAAEARYGAHRIVEIAQRMPCLSCDGSTRLYGSTVKGSCPDCMQGTVTVIDAVTVRVPPGIADGQVLRLAGKGDAHLGGGAAGDCFVTVEIGPGVEVARRGDDALVALALNATQAKEGAHVTVAAPYGDVDVSVPSGARDGAVIVLRGRGFAPEIAQGEAAYRGAATRGDLVVTVSAPKRTWVRYWPMAAAVLAMLALIALAQDC